ncbi:hypothetical protein FKM82_028912 [Ascaphus truei]
MLGQTNVAPAEVGRVQSTHVNALSSLETKWESNDQNLRTLRDDLRTVFLHLQGPRTNSVSTIPSTPLLPAAMFEPQLPTPNRYGGNPHGCRGFLNQCFIQFEMNSSCFYSSRSKVAYIISLLTDDADLFTDDEVFSHLGAKIRPHPKHWSLYQGVPQGV